MPSDIVNELCRGLEPLLGKPAPDFSWSTRDGKAKVWILSQNGAAYLRMQGLDGNLPRIPFIEVPTLEHCRLAVQLVAGYLGSMD